MFDKERQRVFCQTCENVGYRPNYYSVDLDGESPDYVEDVLAEIEGYCKPIIRKIEQDRKMVVGDDYISLMHFLGILSARVPVVRDSFNQNMDDLGKMILRVGFHGKTPKEIFDFMNERGNPLGSIDEARTLIEFASRDDYRLSVDKTYQVGAVFKMANLIAQTLIDRKWSVFYRTDNQNVSFVCGDAPVMLLWQDAREYAHLPPGFALEGTEVIVPLTKNIAIMGRFEGFQAGDSIRAKTNYIRMINGHSINYASRFIFSNKENIPVLLPNLDKADYSFQF